MPLKTKGPRTEAPLAGEFRGAGLELFNPEPES